MTTLLEQAKKIILQRKTPKIPEEEIDLYIAYLKGEVTHTQVNKVLGGREGNIYAKTLFALREAYRQGRIKIIE